MASTGVPLTGRSSAFAKRLSGFHRAKTLTGGSSLTGVSVATGVRRSRTRIDPCLRAARTQAPVRRCSSLIEISFMCHIVTHWWIHRQGILAEYWLLEPHLSTAVRQREATGSAQSATAFPTAARDLAHSATIPRGQSSWTRLHARRASTRIEKPRAFNHLAQLSNGLKNRSLERGRR
jgi:hypothetical protein